MLCRGTVIEQNKKRSCWLVSDPFSKYKLCRRCHFQYITTTLDTLTNDYHSGKLNPPHEILFTDLSFLHELLHPAREQAFLNLLYTLFHNNKIQFSVLVEKLKKLTVFPILLTKRIEAHQPGVRCKMYREFMKDEKLYTSSILCWNCWSCVSWVVKTHHEHLLRLYDRAFPLYITRVNYETFLQTGPHHFVDMTVSLHLRGYHHHLRGMLNHFLRCYPFEAVQRFVLAFLQQPALFHLTFEKKESEYLPLPFLDEPVLREIRRQVKAFIKNATDRYKEELVQVTWHPKRLFPWCLDIEEWNDLGITHKNIGTALVDMAF